MSFHTHDRREGSGPPVILIHGLGASLEQWDPLLDHLALSGYRALALDLLGHGDSGQPEGRNHYHIEAIYRHLIDWIDGLGLDEPPILIGHSLGGYLSLVAAIRRSEKLRGIVLINPYYRPNQLSFTAKISLINSDISTGIFKRTPAWTISQAMRLSELNGQSYPKEIRDQMALDFKRTSPDVVSIPESIVDLGPRVFQITVPTTLIWGNRDLTLNPASFPELADLLTSPTEIQVPDGGHMPHLARPRFFNQVLSRELAKMVQSIQTA